MLHCGYFLGENISSLVLKMSFNNSSSNVNPNNSSSIAKRQTNPWPPSKALEWTIIECVSLLVKHGKFWELRCKFCAKKVQSDINNKN